MYIPFQTLSPQSRIWIYQSDKILTEDNVAILTGQLRAFTDQWLVHGAPIEASFDIRHNRFVVLAANDPTSGCSIDTSVRVMKDLGATISLDFFDRTLVAFKTGDEIRTIRIGDLKKELVAGTWDAETLVFNNAITSLSELQTGWLVPASSTWLSRYLIKTKSL